MQTIEIFPSQLSGIVTIAPSKSMMQRVCAAALLHHGTTIIHHPGKSNDDLAALEIIQQLGATVIEHKHHLEINSKGIKPISSTINCGESGLSARMFASIIALHDEKIDLVGQGSLLKRPLTWFHEVFPQLNVSIKSNNNYLPLTIQGKLQPNNIEVDGSISSQYLTGLLMAYSYSIENNNSLKEGETFTIKVNQLNSKPYIDLTLNVMRNFGMIVPENSNYEKFIFHNSSQPINQSTNQLINQSTNQPINQSTNQPINQSTNQPINKSTNQPLNYQIEGDWSGAAFFLVAAAIHGNITVKGLQPHSLQADNKIIEVLQNAGSTFKFENGDYIFSESNELNAFEFDATDCPDLFPPLVALACFCSGTSNIKGIHRLTHKESNRASSLQSEFRKMGVEIILEDDIMLIHPPKTIKTAMVHSHHDHRIAMAAAIVASKAENKISIEQADAVNKSYPSFYKDLMDLKAAFIK
ncbi:MAG: 3-phosphoshikimate 1-carboxyvinyltransferase [Chitinophagaceae bacterium]|nr:3-phosphoshikimate 1-carboxyvinyltransferase [Chitinophagaceae bacterium]